MINDDLSKKNHHIFGKSVSFWATLNMSGAIKKLSWPGIVTGPRSPHLSAYLHMLHSHVCCTQAARMLKLRSSTCRWSARCESGTLCRFFFERLRYFQGVLCRPFSFLWRIISQKCPISCSSLLSTVSVAIVVCARRSLSADRLNCTRNGEIHKHVRTLRKAQTRQLSERSLERSFAAERNPSRVVALSTVKRSVKVHRFIIAHCRPTRDRLL